MTWHKDMNTAPWISPEFDLTLDCQPVLMAIEQLTFAQMKRKPTYSSISYHFITLFNTSYHFDCSY